MAKDFRSNVMTLAASLADQLADQIVALMRSSSLEEVLLGASSSRRGKRRAAARPAAKPSRAPSAPSPSPAKGRRGARKRRSPAELDAMVQKIVSTLKGLKNGLRAEQIQKRMGASRKELPLALAKALTSRKITKKGQRRATTYFAR